MKLLLVIVAAIVSSTHPAGADDNHLALVQRYTDALIENGLPVELGISDIDR